MAVTENQQEISQGALGLVLQVEAALLSFLKDQGQPMLFPSVATRNSRFPPVLFADRLRRSMSPPTPRHELVKPLQYADRLLDVLEMLSSGELDISRNVVRFLGNRLKTSISSRNTSALFDLCYGALQLVAYAEHREPHKSDDAHDLFGMACGLSLIVAELADLPSLPGHIDHFKVHAAVFLAAQIKGQHWTDAIAQANLYLDRWGDEPAPSPVLVHAAHNLSLTFEGLPQTDQVYDLFKSIRRDAAMGLLSDEQAFDKLDDCLGWRQSAALIRLLWESKVRSHYEHARDAVARCHQEHGYAAALNLAEDLLFVGMDGQPLVKAPPGGFAGQANISFPGGASIGKTAILCKLEGSCVMVDYGSDPFGRTPHWFPELDLLDALLITHAHQDHAGGLLNLYSKQGYCGPWYATAETGRLIRLSLEDSVRLAFRKFGARARFGDADVEALFRFFVPIEQKKTVQLTDRVRVTAYSSGHVAGACQFHLEAAASSVMVSGDFSLSPCRSVAPLELPPPHVCAKVDTLVTEGTYAYQEAGIAGGEEAIADLLEKIRGAKTRPVLVPVLSLGRAQEVIAALANTELRVGVFGLAKRMTEAIDNRVADNITLDGRRADVVGKDDYDVLVASAGCLQGGPSKVFFERADLQPIHVILTGYLFPGTPARTLAALYPKTRFSSHANHADWMRYLSNFPNARKYLIHYPGNRSVDLPAGMIIPRQGRAYHAERVGEEPGTVVPAVKRPTASAKKTVPRRSTAKKAGAAKP